MRKAFSPREAISLLVQVWHPRWHDQLSGTTPVEWKDVVDGTIGFNNGTAAYLSSLGYVSQATRHTHCADRYGQNVTYAAGGSVGHGETLTLSYRACLMALCSHWQVSEWHVDSSKRVRLLPRILRCCLDLERLCSPRRPGGRGAAY